MRNEFVIDTNSNATTSLACWSTFPPLYATISHEIIIIKNLWVRHCGEISHSPHRRRRLPDKYFSHPKNTWPSHNLLSFALVINFSSPLKSQWTEKCVKWICIFYSTWFAFSTRSTLSRRWWHSAIFFIKCCHCKSRSSLNIFMYAVSRWNF